MIPSYLQADARAFIAGELRFAGSSRARGAGRERNERETNVSFCFPLASPLVRGSGVSAAANAVYCVLLWMAWCDGGALRRDKAGTVNSRHLSKEHVAMYRVAVCRALHPARCTLDNIMGKIS